MALTCSIDNLPIDPRYIEGIKAYCSDPRNESECQLICDTPPDKLVEKITEIEGQLQQWTEEGVPPGLAEEARRLDPEKAEQAAAFLETEAPKVLDQERQLRGNSVPLSPVQEFAQGGLATAGRNGDRNLAHVQRGEVVVPNSVFADNPGLRSGLGSIMAQSGARPSRYTVGGARSSINPVTGQQEFFSLGGVLGGIVGGILAAPTGGMSLAMGAGLGAAAGTFVETGDLGQSALMGLGAYGLAGMGVGAGLWGAPGGITGAAGITGFGQGLGAYWTAPGSTALGGMFAKAAPSVTAAGVTITPEMVSTYAASNEITYQAAAAELAAGGASTPSGLSSLASKAGAIDASYAPAVSSATTKGATTAFTNVPDVPLADVNKGVATPSFFDDTVGWIKDNPIPSAVIGSTVLGVLEKPQIPREPSGAEYFNEYDAYKDCLTAGGSEESCKQQHPKGWAEIAPPPESQWLAGTANYGTPGGAGAPTGGIPMTSQPWYSQMSAFGYAGGGHINGAGSETSDSIPARLSNNEFVLTADAVRGAGNGSVKRGAKKLYDLMDKLERRAHNG